MGSGVSRVAQGLHAGGASVNTTFSIASNGVRTAFPLPTEYRPLDGAPVAQAQLGLTKRELFAAMAMQGICTDGPLSGRYKAGEAARMAVEYADALLEELGR